MQLDRRKENVDCLCIIHFFFLLFFFFFGFRFLVNAFSLSVIGFDTWSEISMKYIDLFVSMQGMILYASKI